MAIRKIPDLNQCKKLLTIEEADILEDFEKKNIKSKASKQEKLLKSTSPAFHKQDNYSETLSLNSMKFPFYESNNQNIQKLYLKKNIFISRKNYD